MSERYQIVEQKGVDFIDTQNMTGCNTYCYGDAIDMLNGLTEENRQLKEERKVFFEIVDCFIRGVESEKGISPNDEKFQYAMNQTLNWLIRLRKDLHNPNQYLRVKKQSEKERI